MTIVIMAGAAMALTIALGFLVFGSLVSMNDELPRLMHRAQDMADGSRHWSKDNLPPWASQALNDLFRAEAKGAEVLQQAGAIVLRYMADLLVEAIVVGLYVIFLLFEVKRLRKRVQGGFDSDRAKQILATVQTINDGIANFLKAKVRSSLILALPVTIILFAFGVKFAILWGLLTFICNFIPYVGSLVAYGSPVIFAFLDLPLGWQPFVVALLLLGCHVGSASFVEPMLIGNAVGLSPLIILISLTFWGLCWGLVGMFLAIPLTVALRIVLLNIETTKPIATLMGDD
jgi:AI-2 transport protein TqsA